MSIADKEIEQIMFWRLIVLMILVCLCQFNGYAQTPPITESQAREELTNRGITDEEFKARMREKGYDLDNIQPEQVPQLEQVIEQTLNELEAEKASTIQEDPQVVQEEMNQQAEQAIEEEAVEQAQQSVDEIDEAVREGATLEEAISEELSEEASKNQPPSTIYGHNIFRNKSLEVYRSAKDIKPPSTYVLGPGDEIVVSIFGISQANFAFTINEEGYIKPSQMSRIYLKGIPLKKAEQLIQRRFSQYYVFQPEQFSLTVNAARTITVNIFGEVETYGSFTISAINTAFNALVAAGGPTNIGTIRKIKLIRGRETEVIDVYKFLFDPTVQFDFFLQNNDIIHVPTSEKLVSIYGAIKRPYRYELLEDENLKRLIEFAGGLTVDAYKENIQVTRIVNEQKVIIDVNLGDLINNNTDFDLKNGDIIKIRSIPGRLESYTDIDGAVEFPGRYELTNNMRISDLLNKGTLKEGARTDVAFLLRQRPDNTIRLVKVSIDSILSNPNISANLTLRKQDKLTIFSQAQFTDNYTIQVDGAVRNPVVYPFDPTGNIRIQDAILLAGGLETDAAGIGYIRRTDPANKKLVDYIQVDLVEALKDKDSPKNIELKAGDKLNIFSMERFTDASSVTISGGVRDPGEYDFDYNLTVADVVYLSGGLVAGAMDFAYITRTDFSNPEIREYIRVDLTKALADPNSSENKTLFPLDKIEIMSKKTFTDDFTVSIEGAVRNPGFFQYAESLRLKDVITMAGGLKLEAASNRIDIFRIVMNQNTPTQTVVATVEVNENFELSNNQDFELKPYDIIVVRNVPDFEFQHTITLQGEVAFPGTYALLDNNEKLTSVINRAGGLTSEAFPEGSFMIRKMDQAGPVLLSLDKAMKNEKSRFNYILKAGDVISIPKTKELVTIQLGATLAAELYPDKMLTGGRLNVAYKKGKRAEWYIDEYAAGIDKSKRARRRLITVEQPNGKVDKVTGIFSSPKVNKGSVIKVGVKPVKKNKEKKDKEPVDWGKIVTDGLALTASVLTVLVLATRL